MSNNKNKKIVVGMSGGVDSSAALILLKEQGWQPVGVSLKFAVWQDKKNKLKENICCSQESFDRAKQICQKLDAPYYVLDCKKDFENIVINYFLKLLKNNQTPSPCFICNRDLKFKKLFAFAIENKINYIATGHYAKTRFNKKTGLFELLKAKDRNKDQSYFLSILNQRQLKYLVFALGNIYKDRAYQIAKNYGFDYYLKTRQSQDLCFISSKSMPDYLKSQIGLKSGQIQDLSGNILGTHQGLHFYTIGQRKGINLGQGPWYVIEKDIKKNILIITNNQDDPKLYKKEVVIDHPFFISGQMPNKPLAIKAKVRYNQQAEIALLKYLNKNRVKLIFKKPQRAVTSGQWAVFYQKDVCLGGGIIL